MKMNIKGRSETAPVKNSRGDKRSPVFVKVIAIICILCALWGVFFLIAGQKLFPESNSVHTPILIYPPVLAALSALALLSGKIPKGKVSAIVFIAVSAAILGLGISLIPYSPCHDAMYLNSILEHFIKDGTLNPINRSYMDFWINNKLTVYFYLPFCRMSANAAVGVKLVNSILLCAITVLSALTVKNICGCWRVPLLISAVFAPYMLLCGPYIYLPAIFFSALAVCFYTSKPTVGKLIFVLTAAAAFVLRPTCFGGIFIFAAADAVMASENKKQLAVKAVTVLMSIAAGFLCKGICGSVMYKNGAHMYPDMNNAAMLWTLELGTRDAGSDTGTCSYSASIPDDEPDVIKEQFWALSAAMREDEENKAYDNERIDRIKNNISALLAARIGGIVKSPAAIGNLLINKSANFFGNRYIPYYYKANVFNAKRTEHDFNSEFFDFQNVFLMMFFLAAVYNAFMICLSADMRYRKRLALILGAIAVNAVFIMLTEVSKKYLFDFYMPALLTICITVSDTGNAAKIRSMIPCCVLAAAVGINICASMRYDTVELKNMRLTVHEDEDNLKCRIDFAEKFNERGWLLRDYAANDTELYGRSYAEINFPKEEFSAFYIISPDGEVKE